MRRRRDEREGARVWEGVSDTIGVQVEWKDETVSAIQRVRDKRLTFATGWRGK